MILMVSGRTDIIAFYSKWFLNRLTEGYFLVRNPYNRKLVSKIDLDDVSLFLFCTKNPLPIIPHLKTISQPILFHITLTGYNKDIEPFVPNKTLIIEGIKKISNIIGIDNVVVRYDPILLNDKYTKEYHVKAFRKIAGLLKGYVKRYIISFVDDYKNVRNHLAELKLKPITIDDMDYIGENFSSIASLNDATCQTCAEVNNLIKKGFIKGECISLKEAYRLTGSLNFKPQKIRKNSSCSCLATIDIGAYNSCLHKCKYCYANFNEKEIESNYNSHNDNEGLLIGTLESNDIIKLRKN